MKTVLTIVAIFAVILMVVTLFAHITASMLTNLLPLFGITTEVTWQQGNSVLFLFLMFGVANSIFRPSK